MAFNHINIIAFFFSTFYDLNIFHIAISETDQLVSFYLALIFNIAGITWTLFVFSFELMDAEKKLKHLASHDQLTSLLNRRSFVEFLEHEIKVFNRSGRIFSIILIDLDYFKKINDTFGHSGGDFILTEFSSLLKKELRETDIVCRFGGEEFICLMPGTTSSEAINIIGRIRRNPENFKVQFKKDIIEYKFSAGLYSPSNDFISELNSDSAIDFAEKALYQAKKSGRDCLTVYQSSK